MTTNPHKKNCALRLALIRGGRHELGNGRFIITWITLTFLGNVELIEELYKKLLRRLGFSVNPEKWEKSLLKVGCQN